MTSQNVPAVREASEMRMVIIIIYGPADLPKVEIVGEMRQLLQNRYHRDSGRYHPIP